jgi:hypothetical protein
MQENNLCEGRRENHSQYQLNRRWPPEKKDCKNVTKTVVVICFLKQSGIDLLQSITIRPEITRLNDEAMTRACRVC